MLEFNLDMTQELENLKLPAPELVSYYTDIQRRIIWLDSEVNESTLSITKQILQWNIEDAGIPKEQRRPIKLFIDSPGGDVTSGLALIDVIMTSETEVWTITVGKAYSMAFLIALAAERDRRVGFANGSFLLHDGNQYMANSTSKFRDYMDFNQQTEDRIREFVVSRTDITPEKYDEKLRHEWYFYSDEARKLDVIQHIVGIGIFSLNELLSR